MAITIRNKTTEAAIREIGQNTGEGPSAVISRLATEEKKRLSEVEKLERARRRHAMRELIAMLPKLTEHDRTEIDRAMEEIYDEHGLPK